METSIKIENRDAQARAGEIIELNGFDVYQVEREPHMLRVLSGCAWVTLDGEDAIVWDGEDMLLMPGAEIALISSPTNRPLVFEIGPVE